MEFRRNQGKKYASRLDAFSRNKIPLMKRAMKAVVVSARLSELPHTAFLEARKESTFKYRPFLSSWIFLLCSSHHFIPMLPQTHHQNNYFAKFTNSLANWAAVLTVKVRKIHLQISSLTNFLIDKSFNMGMWFSCHGMNCRNVYRHPLNMRCTNNLKSI